MSRRNNKGRRENSTFANRRLPDPWTPSVSPVPYGRLTAFEDRRLWHPQGAWRPAASFVTPRHRLTLVDRSRRTPWGGVRLSSYPSGSNALVAFQKPSQVLICVRRQMRKEVLHALRKTGKLGQGAPRWSEYSSISCRRS